MSADIAGVAAKRQTHRRSGGEHAITGPQALIAAGNRSYHLYAVPRYAGHMGNVGELDSSYSTDLSIESAITPDGAARMPVIIRNFKTNQGGSAQPGAVMAVGGTLELHIGQQALNNQITRLTIVRRADVEDGHWEMFLEGTGPCVKVDLMEAGYRILYGAAIPAQNAEADVTETNATLRQMVQCLVNVSAAQGDWTGTDQYNCQDFVVEFLKELNVQGIAAGNANQISKSLKYELMRYVRKNKGPDYWKDRETLRVEYGVPVFDPTQGPKTIKAPSRPDRRKVIRLLGG